MKFLITERLSEHRSKTPEGYLICLDAILARTGKQTYRKNEIFMDSNDDSEIEVDRTEDEVFSPATLASFENKPITVEHPDEDVNVHNYKEYAVGFVRDVRKGNVDGKPVMLGNLVITDEETIKEIENGEHTELSCGYDCDIEDEEHPCQKNIRGNHVALCEQGRAGIARIVDSVNDSLVGKKVKIKSPDSWANGEWGIVFGEDGDDVFVGIAGDKNSQLIFGKNEVKVMDSVNDSVLYKGYKIDEHVYLHNEEKGFKYEITKNGVIVGGANSLDEAKAKIDRGLKDSVDDARSFKIPAGTTIKMINRAPYNSNAKLIEGTKAITTNKDIVASDIASLRKQCEQLFIKAYNSYQGTDWGWSDDFNIKQFVQDAIKKYAEDKLGRRFTLEEQSDGSIKATNESGREKIFKNWQEAREEFSKRSITIFDDDKFDKATEQAYRALKLGAMNSEAVIQELKRTFSLSYDDAKRAFMKAHMKYEFEDSVNDVEPREDESKDEFIARFMKETEGEYPDEKQRLAVAYSYWNKKDSVKDADKYSVGQRVRYHGKPTKILKVEYDPRYGYDLLIENPEWDGKNEKLKNVWVGENVDDSVKDADKVQYIIHKQLDADDRQSLRQLYGLTIIRVSGSGTVVEGTKSQIESMIEEWGLKGHYVDSIQDKLVDPPQDIINDFERQLKANGVIITATGKTMILGRKHYQVKYYGSGRELNDIFKRIDQYMRSKNIPMTWSIASDTENDICTAGIDLDKMYVKDSTKAQKAQKIVRAIRSIIK